MDDPILFEQVVRVVLLALELAGKSKEEAERIQKVWIDNN